MNRTCEVTTLAIEQGPRVGIPDLVRLLREAGFAVRQPQEATVTDALLTLIEQPGQHVLLHFMTRGSVNPQRSAVD